MIPFIEAFLRRAAETPDTCAFYNSAGQTLTYGELAAQSGAIATFLLEQNPTKTPVALYGHKAPLMLACIIACMRAGCPYVPLDTVYPASRIATILGQIGEVLVLCTAELATPLECGGRIVMPDELADIAARECAQVDPAAAVDGDDAVYMLFTSGSTGTPKGVVQTASSFTAFAAYVSKFIPHGEAPQVLFNRAPFCFDMSLKNIVTALPYGHTVLSLEEGAETSMRQAFETFAASHMTLWFSTPTFVEMCLTDPSFNEELLPDLRTVVLGGEVLHASAVLDFLERFPRARVYNAYGPTETCVMISDVPITPGLLAQTESLPIGAPAPGTQVMIVDHETRRELPRGETGEICIMGAQVGAGYYRDDAKTKAAFFEYTGPDGKKLPAYLSGDLGYLGADGLVYYAGRIDNQVKIQGFRVELGEIEEAINRLPEIAASCVVARQHMGSNVALRAYVVAADGVQAGRELSKQLKAKLRETLPEYMVPRSFKYRDALPLTANGKIDRKALEAASAQ